VDGEYEGMVEEYDEVFKYGEEDEPREEYIEFPDREGEL